MPGPIPRSSARLKQRTIEALQGGADVVFQATFFDEPEDVSGSDSSGSPTSW